MEARTSIRTQVIPYIFYRDVPAALDWLTRTFGFVEVMRHPNDRGGMHGEMRMGDQLVMMGQGSREMGLSSATDAGTATQGVFVYLADVDAHFERARAAGATIERGLEDLPYGRSYSARDLEGPLVLQHAGGIVPGPVPGRGVHGLSGSIEPGARCAP